MSVQQEKFTQIADAIREKTGSKDKIKPSQFASEIDNVFDAGSASNNKNFWDVLQNKGGSANYYYAFAYGRFTDKNFNPVHDIVCASGSTPGQHLFTASHGITDVKVPVYANTKNANSAFYTCLNLKTIPLFYVYKTTTLTTCFSDCPALENLTMGGEIGQNIKVSDCTKLTHKSLMSISQHLYDYASAGESGTYTFTMGSANQKKLTEAELAEITQKGWSVA